MIELRDEIRQGYRPPEDASTERLFAAHVRAPRKRLSLCETAIVHALQNECVIAALLPDGSITRISQQAPQSSLLTSEREGQILALVLANSPEYSQRVAKNIEDGWASASDDLINSFFSGSSIDPREDTALAFQSGAKSDDVLFETADHILENSVCIDQVHTTKSICARYANENVFISVSEETDPTFEKCNAYAPLNEEIHILQLAAGKFRCNIEWNDSEGMPSNRRSRRQTWVTQAACNWDGKISALRVDCHLSSGDFSEIQNHIESSPSFLSGPYAFPITSVSIHKSLSNANFLPISISQVRHGAALARERMMDAIARHLGVSDRSVRDQNLKSVFRNSATWRSIVEARDNLKADGKGTAIVCNEVDDHFSVAECKLTLDLQTGRLTELSHHHVWQSTETASVSGDEHALDAERGGQILLAPSILGAIDNTLGPYASPASNWPVTSQDLLALAKDAEHSRRRILWKDCC